MLCIDAMGTDVLEMVQDVRTMTMGTDVSEMAQDVSNRSTQDASGATPTDRLKICVCVDEDR